MSIKTIDVHSHFILPVYIDGLAKAGICAAKEDGFPTPTWSVESHLQYMDEAEIELSILSLSTPHIHFGNDKAACELARSINEETAIIRDKHPDRFRFAACLPMPDIAGSIEEVSYAFDVLKADGVKVASNSHGIYLGDPKFDPLFAELNKRKAVMIIHPSKPQSVPENVFTAGVAPLFEYIADTTRAVINLITSGTIERYPDIKIIVPHCGSFLPFVAHRLIGISEVLVSKGSMSPVNVTENISKLYFDIAGDALPVALEGLMKIADTQKIMYGGDFPYTPAPIVIRKKQALMEHPLLAPIKQDVFYNNALRIFGKN
ncbi:MAG: putative hydrolase [Firmicutes bacterium]|nr:putative hydrolase [Bacillota bacterium]